MFPHNCTVYREEEGNWKRYFVYGVLWQDVEGINTSKSGLKDNNTLELYIPFSSNFKPLKKDIVLKGIFDYEIKNKPSELYSVGSAKIVTTIDVFDFGNLRHYKVGGR